MLPFVLFGVASVTVSADPWGSDGLTLGSDGTLHHVAGRCKVQKQPGDIRLFHAVNANDGTSKWISNLTSAGLHCVHDHVEATNNTIYVSGGFNDIPSCPGSLGGAGLLALDGTDGSIRWQFTAPEEARQPSISVAKDGAVYLRSQSCYGYDETVQAIDAHGDLKWSWYGSEFDPPRIFPDQGMMLARRSLGGWRHGDHLEVELQSFSLVDGSVKWTLPFSDLSPTLMVRFGEDGSLFLLQHFPQITEGEHSRRSLLRLNSQDGSILWNVSMSGYDTAGLDAEAPVVFVGSDEVYVDGLLGEEDACNLGVFSFRDGARRNLPCFPHRYVAPFRPHLVGDVIFLPKFKDEGVAEDTFVFARTDFKGRGIISASSGVDGTLLWNVSIQEFTFNGLALSSSLRHRHEDGLALSSSHSSTIFVRNGHHLHCIRNGKEAWNTIDKKDPSQDEALFLDDPVLSRDNTTYALATYDLYRDNTTYAILAIDSDGVERWRRPSKANVVVI